MTGSAGSTALFVYRARITGDYSGGSGGRGDTDMAGGRGSNNE